MTAASGALPRLVHGSGGWQDRLVLAGTPILVMTSHDGERAGIRRDADGFLWISHRRDASPNRVPGTRLEGSEPAQIRGPDRSAVGGVLPPGARSTVVRGADWAWHTAEVGHEPGLRSHRTTLMPPARLRSGSAMSAESWCRARRRPRFPPPGVLTRIKHQLLARGPSKLGGACPASGASDWRVVVSGSAPSAERIFCGVCGHNHGAVYGFWSPRA